MTLHYFSTSSGRIELAMTLDQAQRASHQGECDKGDGMTEIRTGLKLADVLRGQTSPHLASVMYLNGVEVIDPFQDAVPCALMLPSREGRVMQGNAWYYRIKWNTHTVHDTQHEARLEGSKFPRFIVTGYHSREWENIVERVDLEGVR